MWYNMDYRDIKILLLVWILKKVQIGIQTEDSLIPVVVIFIIGISICVITIMIYTNKYCKK